KMRALSTLFYPQSDALFVSGNENSSYWLILFVKSNIISSGKSLYFIGISVESVFLVSGVVFHGKSGILLWKHKVLHMNLTLIATNFYFMFHAGSIARLAMILYETRLINLKELGDAPLPQLEIVRISSFAHAFCLLFISTIERVFATYYVSDYEKTRRLHIPIVIISIADLSLILAAYAMVAGVINGYVLCIVSAIPNFVCVALLRILLNFNRRRLAGISHILRRSANDEYSLSLRMQLKENIWSIQV
ncbi:hypothetical protein PMAYCL1PPCAC_05920, partial [Pristionchus mayeri]